MLAYRANRYGSENINEQGRPYDHANRQIDQGLLVHIRLKAIFKLRAIFTSFGPTLNVYVNQFCLDLYKAVLDTNSQLTFDFLYM